LPALAGALLAVAWGLWLIRGAPEAAGAAEPAAPADGAPRPDDEERMFSLKGAAAVAALLSGVQAMVHGLSLWLGPAGLLAGTVLGALVELHSTLAAVFATTLPTSDGAAIRAVMLALAVHALSKSVTAGLVGGVRYLAWLAPGLWAHTALGIALLYGM